MNIFTRDFLVCAAYGLALDVKYVTLLSFLFNRVGERRVWQV